MAAKPKKTKPVRVSRAKAGKGAARRSVGIQAPPPVEHRVAVASLGMAISYGRLRTEVFELRGTAALNATVAEELVRTTGYVALSSGSGKNMLTYAPASLNRNLSLTLHVDAADLALLREIFVTGTGSEISDPALTVWATTAQPVKADIAGSEEILEFGYRLDFDPGPIGPR